MSAAPAVPAYEPMLAAYHRGFAVELRSMVGTLPIEPGQSVLDMACGDGAYSPWLAERVGESGRVVGVDVAPEYLELARAEAAKSPLRRIIKFLESPIEMLPFDDGEFDLVWCAQSLYSLPDPTVALKQMMRVTKPGGAVAVLEADSIHHMILPWPVEVELSVRAAELQAFAAKHEEVDKFYIGRRLRSLFREAGLERIKERSFATDRAAPLGNDETTYLVEYFKQLTKRIDRYFDGEIRDRYDELVDLDSEKSLLAEPDFAMTCIDHVVWGFRV